MDGFARIESVLVLTTADQPGFLKVVELFPVHFFQNVNDFPKATRKVTGGKRYIRDKLETLDPMPEAAARQAVLACVSHNTHMRNAGTELAPKHHWWFEMCCSLGRNGSPVMYSTYPDEDFNQVLASVGRGVYGRTFILSCIKKYRVLCLVRGQEP